MAYDDDFERRYGKSRKEVNEMDLDDYDENGVNKKEEKKRQAVEESIKDVEASKLDRDIADKLRVIKIMLHSRSFDDAAAMIAEVEDLEKSRAESKGYCDNPEVYWCKVLLKNKARDEDDLISKKPDLSDDNDFSLTVDFSKTDEQKQRYLSVAEKIKQAETADREKEAENNKKQADDKAEKQKAALTAEEEARQKRLKRVARLIDAGDFDEAKERLEKIEQEEEDRTGDCEIPQVYHYKMLLDYEARTDEELIASLIKKREDITQNKNYRLAKSYAMDSDDDDELDVLLNIKKQIDGGIAKAKEADRLREEKKRKLENTIKQADAAFEKKDYQKAADLYNQAITLGGTEVKQKAKLAAQKAEEEKRRCDMEGALKQADAAFAGKDYQKALDLYNEAAKLGATGLKTKIDQAAKKLKEDKARRQKIADIVQKADEIFESGEYQSALDLYNQAITLGGGKEVKQKAEQAAQKVEEERQKRIKEEEERRRKINGLVRQAAEAYNGGDYQKAIDLYNEAVKLGATGIKNKINQAVRKLREEEARKQALAEAIQQGDNAFENKNYQNALDLYNQAITLGGGEEVKQKAEQAAQKVEEERQKRIKEEEERRQKINGLVSQAAEAYNGGDYQKAVDMYNEAAKLGATGLKTKIDQAARKLREEEARKQALAEAIQQGDNAFESKNYQSALDWYNRAAELGGGEEAKQKSEQAAQKIEEERQSKIADFIRQGDNALKEKDYKTAINLYNQAASLGSTEASQKAAQADEADKEEKRLKKIADIINQADAAFESGEYQSALDLYNKAVNLGSAEAKQKSELTAQKIEEKRLSKIANYIKRGDAAFERADYQKALDLYSQAAGLGSTEAEQKVRQADEAIKEAERKSKIADYIRQGDAAFKGKDYKKAISLYTSAGCYGSYVAFQKAEQAKEELLKVIADVIKQADAAFENKDYSNAVKLYNQATDLGSKDVQQKLEQTSEKMWEENRKRVEQILNETGAFKVADKDTVFLGAYPQSLKGDDIEIGDLMDKELNYYLGSDNFLYEKYNNKYYKVEPIKWKVLSRGLPFAKKYFVAADQILDAHRFDDDSNNYMGSEIRSWLNKDFYNKAFREEQKSKIVTTNVDNSLSSTGDSSNRYVCGNTSDKVFLLSHKETAQYFTSNESRKRVPTEYAVARGAYQYTGSDCQYKLNGKGCGGWWLRSPYYYYDDSAQAVYYRGDFSYFGVDDDRAGVLCALKIKP